MSQAGIHPVPTADELRRLLDPAAPALPELEAARADLAALRSAPHTALLLARTSHLIERAPQLPTPTYTAAREFSLSGDRRGYEQPYFQRRSVLSAAAIRVFLGQPELLPFVHDYLWAICEESSWVVPAHAKHPIDLFAAETGFLLAECVTLLGDALDAPVRERVAQEIERRIFAPYLANPAALRWYRRTNNWNGVCNGSVACTFLLLDPDQGRAAEAVASALAGLEVYLTHGFAPDGSSNEGISYWHYGLFNVVALAEILRARSGRALDLLAEPRMGPIAAYPAKLRLSGDRFATFSDVNDQPTFHPSMVVRLAERTGEPSLWELLAHPAQTRDDWRLPLQLRALLWWDGRQPPPAPVGDALLPAGGIARLTASTPDDTPVVLALKAGHNGEHHNQNDLGSLILHVGGESLLTDPGRGLYTRDYFGPRRYENIFANSYGHSVPRIGGALQSAGAEFRATLDTLRADGPLKRVAMSFGEAYALPGLLAARRTLELCAAGADAGTAWLTDEFSFATDAGEPPPEVEEALITWAEVELEGPVAIVRGERHAVRLVAEEPAGSRFALERLEEQSRANGKERVLKRITLRLPAAPGARCRIRLEAAPGGAPAPHEP